MLLLHMRVEGGVAKIRLIAVFALEVSTVDIVFGSPLAFLLSVGVEGVAALIRDAAARLHSLILRLSRVLHIVRHYMCSIEICTTSVFLGIIQHHLSEILAILEGTRLKLESWVKVGRNIH